MTIQAEVEEFMNNILRLLRRIRTHYCNKYTGERVKVEMILEQQMDLDTYISAKLRAPAAKNQNDIPLKDKISTSEAVSISSSLNLTANKASWVRFSVTNYNLNNSIV
ncbi:hypothetical protein CVS40_8717 [Lucilia cuprina]|nr:hypothetical protein CVS40_8717 [Lucilia cuprina]